MKAMHKFPFRNKLAVVADREWSKFLQSHSVPRIKTLIVVIQRFIIALSLCAYGFNHRIGKTIQNPDLWS